MPGDVLASCQRQLTGWTVKDLFPDTRLAGTERRWTPTSCVKRRAWRVATRLAVPRVFLFRTPASGNHGAVNCMSL